MVYNNKQALARANADKTNVPGTCQMTTRGWFGAPSAGDRDRDGDADANDGWLSEPKSARVLGDRTPPSGLPLYFRNKSGRGFGHRAISKNGGLARSTDMSNGRYSPGKVGDATIAQIEAAMGLVYVGYSKTITGQKIPIALMPPKPTPPPAPAQAPKKYPGRLNIHLDPKKYMDYEQAIKDAEEGESIDIDEQLSANGTPWGFHWPTVGKNHLHAPAGSGIKATTRIDHLTDKQIDTLRGPKGQRPRRLIYLIRKANAKKMRVELEIKKPMTLAQVRKFWKYPIMKIMTKERRLVVKALAAQAYPIVKLAPWQEVGAITLMSFTDYKGKGISKKRAWPAVDYYRGKPKWVA